MGTHAVNTTVAIGGHLSNRHTMGGRCQNRGDMIHDIGGAIRRTTLNHRQMTDSTLLGFWTMGANGLPADRPQWRRPVLPGESMPPELPTGSPAVSLPPIRYRKTVSGRRVAWDEPGENF
jgi:hypothetical protein